MITVLDYKAGNIRSVERALEFLGIPWKIARHPEDLAQSERLIFPGVGHAQSAMEYLHASGLADALSSFAATGRPFLGICLGSQIVLDHSDEGDTNCLGILEGRVPFLGRLFGADSANQNGLGGFLYLGERYKVPHMGWNTLSLDWSNTSVQALFRGIPTESSYYFVHSYYTLPEASTQVLAYTEYGGKFASGLGRDNIAAFQFHPEKSGKPGLQLLANFSVWRP